MQNRGAGVRRRVFFRVLRGYPSRTRPPVQVWAGTNAGSAAGAADSSRVSARAGFRPDRAGSDALETTVAARVQPGGAAGAGVEPADRYAGRAASQTAPGNAGARRHDAGRAAG